MTGEEKLQRLIDKDDIQERLQDWARAVARKDWDAVRHAFHDEATDAHGTFEGGITQFVEWQIEHHVGIEQSVHFIGAPRIEFADPTAALSETYVIAFHRYGVDARSARRDIFGPGTEHENQPKTSIIAGRYIDRFEKRREEWRIAKRVTVFEWIKLENAPWTIPFQPNWTPAKRDGSDPIYDMRREMGLPA
jgi:hypothetical protein